MNLSERLRVDKELFLGERSSYENTEKNQNVSVDSYNEFIGAFKRR